MQNTEICTASECLFSKIKLTGLPCCKGRQANQAGPVPDPKTLYAQVLQHCTRPICIVHVCF